VSVTIVTIDGIDATLGGLVETTTDWNALRGRVRARSNTAFERSGRGARFTGSTYPVDQMVITHKIVAPAGQREATLARIEGIWYDPFEPAPGDEEVDLVFLEDGIEKTARVVPGAFGEHPDNSGPTCQENWWYQGTWDVLDPVYYAADPTVTDGASPVVEVPVRGTVPSRRVRYEITPTVAKAAAVGQRFRRLVTIANRSARPWVRWPVLLTPGGMDHAALTPGSSMTGGEDVEGYAAARRVPVWSDNWDNAATLVWAGCDAFPAGRYWTLRSDASSGATAFDVLEPITSPPGETWHVMSEAGNIWRVTAYDAEEGTLDVEDAARDTAAEALSAGDKLWWVAPQGLVDLAYGWTSAPDPNYDARVRPIIDLAASSNGAHVYAEYYEPIAADNIGARHPRPGSPVLRALADYSREFYSGDGDQYLRTVPEDNGEPATAIGLAYNADGPVSGRPLADRWDFESPIGITGIEFDWEVFVKYGASGGGSIKRGRLACILVDGDGNEIVGVRRDTDDGASGSEALTPAVPIYTVSFRYEAYDRKLAPNDGAPLEPADGTVWTVDALVLTFAGDETPLVAFPGDSHDIYQIGRPDAPATLSTTAGAIEIRGAIVDLDDTLVIDADADAGSVTAESGARALGHLVRGAAPPIPADLDDYPDEGAVDVSYDEDGDTGVSISVIHRDAWN